ncbi:hypothetical protein AVEN_28308-1 [Araneus ventricosus]|uniref:Carboxylesterase type B domain-containing protein n=1 Tax=Araneus ventricosus TaxID=182803 RepID=A0A4Y2DKF1_ARAVE|nr:hypothetical protein AVEN_28308-1 [Araneus ventricosus]
MKEQANPGLKSSNKGYIDSDLMRNMEVYRPGRESSRVPVLVFIHGESYEWNAGNPYDGSVLASFGKVVVVTVNFRLGVLAVIGVLNRGCGAINVICVTVFLHHLAGFKDAIRQALDEIYEGMLRSAVTGVVIRLTCTVLCGGGHV